MKKILMLLLLSMPAYCQWTEEDGNGGAVTGWTIANLTVTSSATIGNVGITGGLVDGVDVSALSDNTSLQFYAVGRDTDTIKALLDLVLANVQVDTNTLRTDLINYMTLVGNTTQQNYVTLLTIMTSTYTYLQGELYKIGRATGSITGSDSTQTSLSTGVVGGLDAGRIVSKIDLSTGTVGILNYQPALSTGTSGGISSGRITDKIDLSTGTKGGLNYLVHLNSGTVGGISSGRLSDKVDLSTGTKGVLNYLIHLNSGTVGAISTGRISDKVDLSTGTKGILNYQIHIGTGTNGGLSTGRLLDQITSTGIVNSIIWSSTNIHIPHNSNSDFKLLKDYFKFNSASNIYPTSILDNGDGTIKVSSGCGIFKLANNPLAETFTMNWNANNSLYVASGAINYIYVDYNGGSPIIKAGTNYDVIDKRTQSILGFAFKEISYIDIIVDGLSIVESELNLNERLLYSGLVRLSGGILSETGNLYVVSTPGVFYYGRTKIITNSKDTSGADVLEHVYYRDGGTDWKMFTSSKQLDNLRYDDGSGTLAALLPGRYAVHWLYISMAGDIVSVYGQGNYTLTDAQNATVPTTVPNYCSQFCVLAAKVIILRGAVNFLSITPAYTTQFPITTASNHNDLGGLQGGTADEYYHLTQTIYDENTSHTSNSSHTFNAPLEINAPDGRQILCTDTSGDWLSFYLHPTNQDLLYWKYNKTLRLGTSETEGGSTITEVLSLNKYWINFHQPVNFESTPTFKTPFVLPNTVVVSSIQQNTVGMNQLQATPTVDSAKVLGNDGSGGLTWVSQTGGGVTVTTKTINMTYSFDVVVATSQFVAMPPATWIFNNNQNRVYNITGVQFSILYVSTTGPCSFNIAVSTTSDGTNSWYYMFTGSVTINTNSMSSAWSIPDSYAIIDILPTKMALHILEAPISGSLASAVTISIQYWKRED